MVASERCCALEVREILLANLGLISAVKFVLKMVYSACATV